MTLLLNCNRILALRAHPQSGLSGREGGRSSPLSSTFQEGPRTPAQQPIWNYHFPLNTCCKNQGVSHHLPGSPHWKNKMSALQQEHSCTPIPKADSWLVAGRPGAPGTLRGAGGRGAGHSATHASLPARTRRGSDSPPQVSGFSGTRWEAEVCRASPSHAAMGCDTRSRWCCPHGLSGLRSLTRGQQRPH